MLENQVFKTKHSHAHLYTKRNAVKFIRRMQTCTAVSCKGKRDSLAPPTVDSPSEWATLYVWTPWVLGVNAEDESPNNHDIVSR